MSEESYKVVTWDPETTSLGLGVDWNSQKTYECPFDMSQAKSLDENKEVAGFEAKFFAKQVENVKDICEAMSVAAEASMKANIACYGTGITAKAKMANALTKKKHVQTLIATCEVEFESSTIHHKSDLWHRLAVDVSQYTENEFCELFGDAYFHMVTKGSACYIIVSIQENETNKTSDITAALSATVKSINISGKLDTDVQNHLELFENNSTIEINVLIVGAEATAITLDLNGLLDYASSFLQNISLNTAVPTHGTIRPYSHLAGYGGFKTGHERVVFDKTRAYKEMVDDYYQVVDRLETLDDLVNNPNKYSVNMMSDSRSLKNWYISTWQVQHKALQDYVTACANFISNPCITKMCQKPAGWEDLPIPEAKLPTFARFNTSFWNKTSTGEEVKAHRLLLMTMVLSIKNPEKIGHLSNHDGEQADISIYVKTTPESLLVSEFGHDNQSLGIFVSDGDHDCSNLSEIVKFVTQEFWVRFDSFDYIVASIPTS